MVIVHHLGTAVPLLIDGFEGENAILHESRRLNIA
jgi:hypothetical protein